MPRHMRHEQVGSSVLPKVGFGTWSIGGGMSADPRRDAGSLAALRSALELGYTHFDAAEIVKSADEALYAAKHAGRDRLVVYERNGESR